MKRLTWFFTLVLMVLLSALVAGCQGKSASSPVVPPTPLAQETTITPSTPTTPATPNIPTTPTAPSTPTTPITPAHLTTPTETVTKTTPIYTKPAQYEYSATIKYDQTEWTYLIHISQLYDGTKSVPLVLALHPANGNSAQIATITGFNTIAERENFIVVYPKSYNAHWNCKTKALQIQDVDEIGFIASLIDNLSQKFNIDSKKIFVTGLSSGGSMCFALAGQLSEKIAAMATVGSTIFEDMLPELKPKVSLSVLHIHGTNDPVIPWQGGNTSNIKAFSGGAAVRVFSVPETIKFWVDSNRCVSTPDITQMPDNNPNDGTRVKIEKHSGGANGTEVVLYSVDGGGHTWPDSKNPLYEVATGKICHDFDASEVIWQFFKEHPKEQ